MPMTTKEVYEKLRELGFTDDRILGMTSEELEIWVVAVEAKYGKKEKQVAE